MSRANVCAGSGALYAIKVGDILKDKRAMVYQIVAMFEQFPLITPQRSGTICQPI